MEIRIKNFRGCESAELSLSPIALVCGLNGAGKTSIAQAVSAAIVGNPVPMDGILKKDARMLLRDGAGRGACSVTDPNGQAQVNWPGGSVNSTGNAPRASEIAAGLKIILDMKPAERSALMIGVMDALPTREQFVAAVGAVASEKTIESVWQAIEQHGWDAAHRRARESGAKLKGAWEEITGEKWGEKRGETWTPAVLSDAPDVDPETLRQQLEQAQAELDACIKNRAAHSVRREQLQKIINTPPTDATPYQQGAERLDAEIADIYREIESLPRPQYGNSGDCNCPHCGGALIVNSRTDVRVPDPGLSETENQNRENAIKAAQQKRSELAEKNRQANEALRLIEQQHREIENAKRELAGMADGDATPEQEHAARHAVNQARVRLAASDAMHRAAERHRGIIVNQHLAGVLKPDGLRQQVLAARLAAFNETLTRISDAAEWGRVRLDDDLNAIFDGRPYVLLSASEQWRVRVTLQVAIAGMDGSDVVVIDAADILHRKARNGLFKMLVASKLRALVTMTMDDPGDVPPLSKAGIGRSYWMQAGALSEI